MTADMSQRDNKDPTGYRMGIAPMLEIANKMKEVAAAAKAYISKNMAKEKKSLDIKVLEEHISLLRGAVMIAYPAYHGLPDWDYVYLILEEKMNFLAMWPDCEVGSLHS